MGRMIRLELYKMFVKPLFPVLLICCVCLHLGVIWYQENSSLENGYSLLELSDYYRTHEGLSEQEPSISLSAEDLGNAQMLKAYRLQEAYSEKVRAALDYGTYRDTILEQANLRLNSPLFSGMDAYTHDNLIFTRDTYDALGDISIYPDFDGGLLLLTTSRLSDFLCLLLMTVFVLWLFTDERENGSWYLLKSMKRGHGGLIWSKWSAMVFLGAGIVALVYGSAAILIGSTAGFGDLSRSLQSVEGFMPCVFPISAGEFLMLFFVVKWLGLLVVSVVFAFLCMLLQGTVPAVICFAGLFAVELFLWQTVTINSWIAPLREINLAAILFTEHYFNDFYHVNLLTLAVNQQICGILSGCAFLFGGSVLLFWLHEKEQTWRLPGFDILRKRGRHSADAQSVKEWAFVCRRLETYHLSLPGRGRVALVEGWKLFAVGRGLLVLAAALAACFFLTVSARYYMSESEYYYRAYSCELEGEWTEEKEQFFDREENRLARLAAEEGEDVSTKNSALDQARQQFYEVKAYRDQGIDAAYVYLTPWQFLLGRGVNDSDLAGLAVCFLGLILFTSSCGALEKQNEMYQLLSLTVVGRRGILLRKSLWVQLFAAVLALCAFLPRIFAIHARYGLTGADLPVFSIMPEQMLSDGAVFPALVGGLSLGTLLVLKYLALFFCVLAVGELLLLISERVRSRILTILIGSIGLLMPVAVCWLGG
ncbi:MAG: hypothetical protein ACLRS1_08100 [Oscillospiraceae bacterium]